MFGARDLWLRRILQTGNESIFWCLLCPLQRPSVSCGTVLLLLKRLCLWSRLPVLLKKQLAHGSMDGSDSVVWTKTNQLSKENEHSSFSLRSMTTSTMHASFHRFTPRLPCNSTVGQLCLPVTCDAPITHSCGPLTKGKWPKLRLNVHHCGAKFPKKAALQGLGKYISNHLLGWAVFYGELLVMDSIGHKEIVDVDMATASAAGLVPILFQ